MSVQVRLFAALRAAAGTSQLSSEAATVGDLRRELSERFGEPFAARLARSKAIVDGEEAQDSADLGAAAEVALLPPFSGG